MKLSVALVGFLCAATLVYGSVPFVQDQEDVRGAFLTSRPKDKSSNPPSNSRPSRRKPRPVVADNKKPDNSTDNKGTKTDQNNSVTESKGTKAVNAQRLGLGLTLFMRDSTGLAVRTDPSRVFQKGDRVRVLLETNADGYLYIFNTTNDGPPVMVYPDADLDDAGNYLQAHVPFEIPSSLGAEERLRWLTFDENAGDEKLFFVFSKEPLKGIPIDDELLALCRDSKPACPVKPTAEVWATVEKELKQPLKSDTAVQDGLAQTTSEHQASTRGLGLAKDDPQPSLIMMASSKGMTLVTTLDLIHK